MSMKPGKQRVVIYRRNGELKPYATAYDDDQSADMLDELQARYGHGVEARTVYGDSAELAR